MAVTARGRPVRKDMFKVSVTVNGEDFGVWDVKTGGAATSSQGSPYRTGALGPPVALGGTASTDNIVLNRLVTLEDDWGRMHKLVGAAGRGEIVIKQAALDTDGNVFKSPLVHKGVLMRVLPPEVDANSTDPALVEIEAVIGGFPVILP